MVRPTRRSGSKNAYFRKRVPADVLRIAKGQSVSFIFPGAHAGDREIVSIATIAPIIKVSLRTNDPGLTRLRHGLALSQFERMCEAYRKGPQELTHRQIVALSGLIYRKVSETFHDDPIEGNWWETVRVVVENALDSPLDDLLIGGPEVKVAARLERLERYVAPFVDAVLRSEGLVIDPQSRAKLLVEGAKALKQIAEKLKKNAEGDYRADPNAERFPLWVRNSFNRAAKTSGSLTFDSLFERWQREAKPAASTITTWRSYIRALSSYVGHDDPSRVSKEDLIAWKDDLIAAGRSPKGVKDGQLAAARALFNYAVDNGLLSSNPALGVTVRVSKAAGTKMLPYTDEEVARILALADNEKSPYRRWLPWLMALSGARVGELAQLWGRRIVHIDGISVMKIAPAEDGGSLKNEGSERDVPIHPAIIERGFLDFVRMRGEGPLFYGNRRVRSAPPTGSARRHASKGVSNHLATWIRDNGFTDKRKAPNHAFRHWFKSKCAELDVPDSVADAIQGHSERTVAAHYRTIKLSKMDEAIRKLPVPL